MDDLIILTADKNTETVIDTILSKRIQSLNISRIVYKIFVHPHHDSGMLNESHEFLRAFQNQYKYAIAIFDKQDCGLLDTRDNIERAVEQKLNTSGWNNRSSVIAIDPELEIWMWVDSPHLYKALGWGQLELDDWLTQESLRLSGRIKPADPKKAIESALAEKRIPRSSSIYGEIAATVSLANCTDGSFLKFKTTLQNWFGNPYPNQEA